MRGFAPFATTEPSPSDSPSSVATPVEGGSLRRGTADLAGAFALVFIGAGGDHDGRRPRRRRARARPRHRRDGVRGGHISGGHFNPAVTFGFLVTRRMDPALALVYWLTITLDVLMGGPLAGAAMKPARGFGTQLVGNAWSDAWIWYLGPFVGGAAAALLYEWLYLRPPRPVPVGPLETGVEEPRPGGTAVS